MNKKSKTEMKKVLEKNLVIELDDQHWEEIVEKGGKPIVVMFYSPFCPHCMAMMPHFEKYAEEFKDKIHFARIDVNNNPYSVNRYGVMATPTFKFFCGEGLCRRSWVRYIPAYLKRSLKMRCRMEAPVLPSPLPSITTWGMHDSDILARACSINAASCFFLLM
jgi:thioredoxin 1